MTRRVTWMIGVVLVLAAAGVGWWWFQHRRGAGPDAGAVALPGVVEGEATSAFLSGAGQSIVLVHAVADGLLAVELTAPNCEALLTELQDLGSPSDVLEIAQQVPDPTIAELAVEELSATLESLGHCFAGSSSGSARLAFVHEVLERRLAQVGV